MVLGKNLKNSRRFFSDK
ncbi:hypothetical protein AB3S75_018103 [Citrus x aurantiifolia]